MAQVLLPQYLRWLDWEQDATAKVIASLHSVPNENRSHEAYQKALTMFGHTLVARQAWLYRLGITSTPPTTFFPTNVDLTQLETGWAEVFAAYRKLLSSKTDDAEFATVIEYQSSDAGRFKNTFADVLVQLNGHGSYHRGQIAMLVKQLGGTPAITDFIYWARESV